MYLGVPGLDSGESISQLGEGAGTVVSSESLANATFAVGLTK